MSRVLDWKVDSVVADPLEWVDDPSPRGVSALKTRAREEREAKYTQEDWLREVKRGKHPQWIPPEFVNQEIYDAAVEFSPIRVFQVPEEYKTPEMWEKLIEDSPVYIDGVPPEVITRRMCELSDIEVWNIPEEFFDRDLIQKLAPNWGIQKLINVCPERYPGWFWGEVYRAHSSFLGAKDQDFLKFCLGSGVDPQDPRARDKFNGKIHFRRKDLVL